METDQIRIQIGTSNIQDRTLRNSTSKPKARNNLKAPEVNFEMTKFTTYEPLPLLG